MSATHPTASDIGPVAVSIKAIVPNLDDQVLLARNAREEWELPGGRMEPGEEPREALQREVIEETGLQVQPHESPIHTAVFDVLPPSGRLVFLVTYSCEVIGGDVRTSSEHVDLEWFAVSEAIGLSDLPSPYQDALRLFNRD